MTITIEKIMEQAQVFASSWALVGTPLAQENQLQLAGNEKELLEEMLEYFQEETDERAAPGNFQHIAEGLVRWHKVRLEQFDKALSQPADTEVRIGTGDDALLLNGERLKGFRMGLAVAQEWIEKFPLSIERTSPSCDEEQ